MRAGEGVGKDTSEGREGVWGGKEEGEKYIWFHNQPTRKIQHPVQLCQYRMRASRYRRRPCIQGPQSRVCVRTIAVCSHLG